MTHLTHPQSPGAQHPSQGLLQRSLDDFRLRLLYFGFGGATAWGIAAGIAVLLIFAWIDLVVELPNPVRLACTLSALGVAVLLIAWRIRVAQRGAKPLIMARQLDAVANTHGQIAAGVDLADSGLADSTASPLTAGLSELAVRTAAGYVQNLDLATAVPRKILTRPMWALGAICLPIVLVALLSPSMLATQVLRFFDPLGDHPPYSPLKLSITPGNTSAIYGGEVDVRASVTGGAPERVDLVLRTPGANDEVLPMFPDGDGSWKASAVDLTAAGQYFVRTGRARTTLFSLGIVTVPKLTDVHFRVQLPAYTHRPAYEGPLPQNGIAGLPGTTVDVFARSNRPLSGGSIAFIGAAGGAANGTFAMSPLADDNTQVTGRFIIRAAGRITIGVTDVAGQPSTETVSAAVSVLADERPFVRILDPKPNSFATPDAVIKVDVLGEDDFGISRMELFRGLNQSQPRPLQFDVPPRQPTQLPGTTMLELADYGVKPGDAIQLFAHVEDNDPAGPKGSYSSVVNITIVSQEEMDKMIVAREGMEALQNKYAVAARRAEAAAAKLEELQKDLAALDPKSPLADGERKKIADAAKSLRDAADAIDKLAAHDMPFDVDHAMSDQLKQLAQKLKNSASELDQAGAPGTTVAQAADQIKRTQSELNGQREQYKKQAMLPLDLLAKVYPLIEDQARFLDIYQRQKDLVERIKSVQGLPTDDPQTKAQMRDLEDEQQRIRGDLRDLLDDIDNHVAQLPADHQLDKLRTTGQLFAAACRASAAAGQMQDTESSLEQFAGNDAEKNAQAAFDTLDQFVSKGRLVAAEGQQCLKFDPTLATALGNTVSQMLGAVGLPGGVGMGVSGGYSAMRSSLQNVGLYGTLPIQSQEDGGDGHANNGAATDSRGTANDSKNPDNASANNKQNASGQSDADVPPQYKAGVGEYFRRVNDELSN